jgi:hypothetical protein
MRLVYFNNMLILQLEQNGEAERFALIRWNQGLRKVESNLFDLVAEKYPFTLKTIDEKGSPPWGCGWYKKNKDGMLELFKQNWDTSG